MTFNNTIDYEAKTQIALRSVMYDVLLQTAINGLPGKHHFYISFLTNYPGVEIPSHVAAQYPDEMTIVLQYEFWDLKVNPEFFSVKLCFDEEVETIKIPFKSITDFADPFVNFGLEFTPIVEEIEAALAHDSDNQPLINQSSPEKTEPGSNVISLDIFRKK